MTLVCAQAFWKSRAATLPKLAMSAGAAARRHPAARRDGVSATRHFIGRPSSRGRLASSIGIEPKCATAQIVVFWRIAACWFTALDMVFIRRVLASCDVTSFLRGVPEVRHHAFY